MYWTEPGALSFYRHRWHRERPSTTTPHLVVWHWDVSPSSRSCYHTLLDRGLSIHFMLDADGTVYQALDAAREEAWHARPTNRWSVGIEVNNPVSPRFAAATGRAVEAVTVHGHEERALAFTPAQVHAVILLAGALSDALGVPRVLPAGDGPGGVSATVDPRVASGEFRGHAGHYHVTDAKWDPGTSLWAPLREAGWGVA